jgi:hypothetical protein
MKSYIQSQQDFPQGVGVEVSVELKRKIVGWDPLYSVHPDLFQKLINRLRVEYGRIKSEKDNKRG